jgi:hypothetical protein
MTDPEEFQPSGLPEDAGVLEADEADVEEQVLEVPDAGGGGLPTSNTAQGSTGPEPEAGES